MTHVYFAPTHREEDDKRQNNLQGSLHGELQRKVASCGHQVSKTTIRSHLHANKLLGMHARKKE